MLAGLVLALAAPALAQSVDVTVLAASCATCHGRGLGGSGAVPSLKGKRSADIATALKAFQSGERPATIMTRLTKGWSAGEIDALAATLGETK
jgi:cytochrome c553